MKFLSTGMMTHVVAFVAAGMLTPCLSAAQIALPGDLDPAGRVYTHIVARVGERGSNSQPIAGLTVYVVSEDGQRLTLRTNMGGVASSWLARARYRIVTPDPFQFEGRLYTWDTSAVIHPGMAVIRLQLTNAKSRDVPVVTWRAGDTSSREALTDGRIVRSIERDGVAATATVNRRDDLIWADVTISNGSNRKLDFDPQTFTLNDPSTAQPLLHYRTPTDASSLNRALTENTLMPGQNIAGAVFFERDKKARDVVLRIPLSGVTFDVPLTIR